MVKILSIYSNIISYHNKIFYLNKILHWILWAKLVTSTNNIPIRGKLSINWKFNSHILKIKKENTCKCKLLMALVTRVIPKMGITLMIMQSFVKPHTGFSGPLQVVQEVKSNVYLRVSTVWKDFWNQHRNL